MSAIAKLVRSIGPRRRLFAVSAIAKLVARRAGEEALHRERHRKVGEEDRGRDGSLQGQCAPPLSQSNHNAAAALCNTNGEVKRIK